MNNGEERGKLRAKHLLLKANATYDYNDLYVNLQLWSRCNDPAGVHIYQVIPDDPQFTVNRAYRGSTIDEIMQAMEQAGWTITNKPN